MPRRVIYIKNPTEGSHFRTIDTEGEGGTGGAKGTVTRRPGLDPMEELFAWMARGHQTRYADRVKKGKGVPYTPGVFVGTGGARYKMAPSNWFQHQAPAPQWNLYTGPGIANYEQQWSPFSYNELGAADPNVYGGMNIQPPWGTPGTLEFGAGTWLQDPFEEQFHGDPGEAFPGFFGGSGPPFSHEYSAYSTQNPNWNAPAPAWVQAWQRGQKQTIRWDATKRSKWKASWLQMLQDYTGVEPPPFNPITIPFVGEYK